MSDCNCNDRDVTRCGSPCGITESNTAACESLPSQIQNFTTQFFGTVIKTETDGVVSWSLPCSLDIGLPANPRGDGEGLACYFLRLFSEGIVGLKGDPGVKGDAGIDGRNSFTVTLGSFQQPTEGNPNVQVSAAYNPAMLVGEYIFIATSGWYLITATDTTGALFLTMAKALPGASGTITAGKLVVPAGYPGASIQGPEGDPGTKGDTGATGDSFTSVNGKYFAPVGTNYALQIAYAGVTFVNSSPSILLPAIGNYLVTVVADILGTTGVASNDVAFLKLFNTTTNADVPASEHELSNIIDTERKQIVLNTILSTTGLNQTIQLYGKATTANKISVVALNTTITYVRIG
jgi:hypothetical protein